MVICPECGSKRTAQIIYGYPSEELFEFSEQGKVILGGCELIDDQHHPDYGCLECKYQWAKELLPADKITKIRYKVMEQGLCTIDMQRTWIYEIFPDGKCVYYLYQGQDKHYKIKEVETINAKKIYKLAAELQKIIGAPLWERHIIRGEVCDGCAYNLQITYADKRKEVLTGDVAGGTFDSILEKFVHDIFQE